jgi:HK97 gp10 family phage protein
MAKDITVTIDKSKLEALIRTAPKQAALAIKAMAFDGERDVKQSFGTSPSAAGSPPGVDTGALRASIRTEKLGDYSYQIVTGVEYAIYLEMGSSKMSARPFMGPMAMRLQKAVDTYFKDIFD